MPQLASQPVANTAANLVPSEVGYRVSALPFDFVGGIVRLRTMANIVKLINGAATPNTGFVTPWTPAANFMIRLELLILSGSIAGRYTFSIGGVTQGNIVLLANQALVIPFPNGGFCRGNINEALSIGNFSGAASDIFGMAVGGEVG